MPGRGRVQRGGDTGEGRIADAQRHQHVQQRGPVVVPADHGGQVAGWIEAAPLRRAHVAQHGGALPHVHQLQRVHVPARHHRVEHEPAHLARMGQREPLRDVGAVRDPVHGEPGDAERRPQRLDVGDRIRGGVEPPVRPDGRRARADRGGRGHRQVRCAHLPLQRRAVQRPRPGAALVEHHQPVAVAAPARDGPPAAGRTARPARRDRRSGRGARRAGPRQRPTPRPAATAAPAPGRTDPAARSATRSGTRDPRARPHVPEPGEALRRLAPGASAARTAPPCSRTPAREGPPRGQHAKHRYAHTPSVGPRHHIRVTPSSNLPTSAEAADS